MAEIIVFSDTNYWVKIPVDDREPIIFRDGFYDYITRTHSKITKATIRRWVGKKWVRERGIQGKDGAMAPHDILRPVAPIVPRQHWNAT